MNHDTPCTALVLAAHGSNADASVNDLVRSHVDRLAGLTYFTEVSPAFHQGEPSFDTVLDQLSADRVTVVPLMTSRGYYADVVLPEALSKNRRYPAIDVTITDPVGTHPDMPSIVGRRIGDAFDTNDFKAFDTSVILVGHGTPRHAQSGASTLRLADALRAQNPAWDISAGFLDGTPSIENALADAKHPNVIVETFLMADGPHASRDLPRRLGMAALDDQSLPMAQRVGDRTIVCNSAIGTDPLILDIITDLAVRSATRQQRQTGSGILAGRFEQGKT